MKKIGEMTTAKIQGKKQAAVALCIGSRKMTNRTENNFESEYSPNKNIA